MASGVRVLKRIDLRGFSSEFAKYFLVSLFALACDFLIFLSLSKLIHYAFAAVIGFLSGASVHYLLSVLFVFKTRKFKAKRWAESALFIGVGGAGLAINVGVIALCVELFAASLPLAKFVAAGFSFLFGYAVRKLMLF